MSTHAMKYLAGIGMGLALATSQAAVLYDNGGPATAPTAQENAFGYNPGYTREFIQADDFKLGGSAVIERARVYLAGNAGGIAPSSVQLQYLFYANDPSGGITPPGPGAVLAQGLVNASVTSTGQQWMIDATTDPQHPVSVPIYAVEFDVGGFMATANVPYWFGIHVGSETDPAAYPTWMLRDPTLDAVALAQEVSWVAVSDTQGNAHQGCAYIEGYLCPADPDQAPALYWADTLLDRSFQLLSTDIPEPASLALLGVGFLGLGASRRRARSAA
jgi:hypothetical protein